MLAYQRGRIVQTRERRLILKPKWENENHFPIEFPIGDFVYGTENAITYAKK
jgi:hypothetical protein